MEELKHLKQEIETLRQNQQSETESAM